MELFAKLLQSQKSFPEYKYDLNKSIPSSKLARLPPHRPEHVSLVRSEFILLNLEIAKLINNLE
jgi:hypothetical protein